MTSLAAAAGEGAVGGVFLKDNSPQPVSDSGVSNGSSLCLSETNVHHASSERTSEPISVSKSSSEKLVFLRVMESERGEKGLSCLSLEVCTSGDNLNMLSQDDDLGGGSGPGSMCGDEEGVGGTRGGVGIAVEPFGGSVPSIVTHTRREEHKSHSPEVEDVAKELVSGGDTSEDMAQQSDQDVVGEEVARISPSGSSRCSSSMGYLEPRPPTQPNSNVSTLSPKDIQRKLMEKVANLGTSAADNEGDVEEKLEPNVVPKVITPSHSSQSLDRINEVSGHTRRLSIGNFLRRKSSTRSKDHAPQTMAASSTSGLILHDRPKTLPAKTVAEERRHQQLHQQMVAAARKKELQKAKEELKKEKQRRERDKIVTESIKEWEKILPKWENMHNTRKVRDLWWLGLPPGIRGKVWIRAIGNDLNISSDLFVINLRRCKDRLDAARNRTDSNSSRVSLSREQSVEVIHLDVLRTFPTLGFFQEGGPYNKLLHDVLGAYACYRPDIGYVQGMSFLAGVLLLNMDAANAFICLANLLNLTSYLAFFKVDHDLMLPYFNTFNILLQDCLPKLSAHFTALSFSPEYYLIEWMFTIYTRTLTLDVACRVWDMFCRDGDSFLFRTALGILKVVQNYLLDCKSIEELGQYLGKLPPMEADTLFTQIESTHFTTKKFKQILSQEQKTTPQ